MGEDVARSAVDHPNDSNRADRRRRYPRQRAGRGRACSRCSAWTRCVRNETCHRLDGQLSKETRRHYSEVYHAGDPRTPLRRYRFTRVRGGASAGSWRRRRAVTRQGSGRWPMGRLGQGGAERASPAAALDPRFRRVRPRRARRPRGLAVQGRRRVFGATNTKFTGGYAEYALASATLLARKPQRLARPRRAHEHVVRKMDETRPRT